MAASTAAMPQPPCRSCRATADAHAPPPRTSQVHTLHTGTMTWDKPVVHGQLPSPRSRHSATAVGNNMVIFGGVGGGNELHILETDTLTWYIPKVSGEPPLPRFGHSATLVESAIDQSRKVCAQQHTQPSHRPPSHRLAFTPSRLHTVSPSHCLAATTPAAFSIPAASSAPPASCLHTTASLCLSFTAAPPTASRAQVYVFGGHDGRRSLSDLHMSDAESNL